MQTSKQTNRQADKWMTERLTGRQLQQGIHVHTYIFCNVYAVFVGNAHNGEWRFQQSNSLAIYVHVYVCSTLMLKCRRLDIAMLLFYRISPTSCLSHSLQRKMKSLYLIFCSSIKHTYLFKQSMHEIIMNTYTLTQCI